MLRIARTSTELCVRCTVLIYATATPSRKCQSRKSHTTTFCELSRTWISSSRDSIYVAVTWLLWDLCFALFMKIALPGSYGTDLCEGVTLHTIPLTR